MFPQAFLYLQVIAFLRILLYPSFVNLYSFDILSAGFMVLLNCWIYFISDFSVLCSQFCTFLNLMFFTNLIKSFSKAANSLIGGGVLWLFNQYFSVLMLFPVMSQCKTFQRILLIIISISLIRFNKQLLSVVTGIFFIE